RRAVRHPALGRRGARPYIATMASHYPPTPPTPPAPPREPAAPVANNGAARLFYRVRRGFIAYARWLDSITWMRFFLLSLLALIVTGILSELPPFNLRWGADRIETRASAHKKVVIDGVKNARKHYEISIDENGVRITPVVPGASAPRAATP